MMESTLSPYHPDPEINDAVAAEVLEAEKLDLKAGFMPRRWTCLCGHSHSRGHFQSIGVHRCLRCGYVGSGGVMWDPQAEDAPTLQASSRRYVYRVAYDKRQKKWVARKVLFNKDGYDTYRTLADAEEIRERYERRDAASRERQKKEASRKRIVVGLQSLTPEDLSSLRDWVVALLQLRHGIASGFLKENGWLQWKT
jgi:hypothetical protein